MVEGTGSRDRRCIRQADVRSMSRVSSVAGENAGCALPPSRPPRQPQLGENGLSTTASRRGRTGTATAGSPDNPRRIFEGRPPRDRYPGCSPVLPARRGRRPSRRPVPRDRPPEPRSRARRIPPLARGTSRHRHAPRPWHRTFVRSSAGARRGSSPKPGSRSSRPSYKGTAGACEVNRARPRRWAVALCATRFSFDNPDAVPRKQRGFSHALHHKARFSLIFPLPTMKRGDLLLNSGVALTPLTPDPEVRVPSCSSPPPNRSSPGTAWRIARRCKPSGFLV